MIKVTVISGGRADWGLLSPVCRKLSEDIAFDLRIVATGQHLMQGSTSIEAIEREGFTVAAKLDMGLSQDDSARQITKAMGRGLLAMADEFADHRPDLLLILGDRYEILGAVCAALINGIPVAHLFGGDVTEGAIDDSIRHAMTKMSHLHFVTNEDSARRVAQLGEDPEHIYNVGSTGLDHLHTMEKMSREEFFESVGLIPYEKNVMVTFHPVTVEGDSQEQCQLMLDALADHKDVGIICTGSNADPEGQAITAMVKGFAKKHENVVFHESLGSKRYLNGLRFVDAMVGNSSSGLYEAPSFGIPTVNIGDRQKGRIKAPSVIDCMPDGIAEALDKALSTPRGENCNPYGDGHAAEKIIKILQGIKDYSTLPRKEFRDLKL